MSSSFVPACAVQLVNVTKTFGNNAHKTAAIQNVSVEARKGELLLFLGPSGSGKTTLLTLIAGLLRPTAGSVFLFGRPVERYSARDLQRLRAEKIGFVFQTFLLIDALTVLENVAIVMRFAGAANGEAQRRAAQLLGQLQIEHLTDKFPVALSQGEKQRVAVARAVANDAELILADEPTANLESRQGFDIIRLLHNYAKLRNRSVIVVSHDLRMVEFADRVLRIEDGTIRPHNPSGETPPLARFSMSPETPQDVRPGV